jgi:hypothetical protein
VGGLSSRGGMLLDGKWLLMDCWGVWRLYLDCKKARLSAVLLHVGWMYYDGMNLDRESLMSMIEVRTERRLQWKLHMKVETNVCEKGRGIIDATI